MIKGVGFSLDELSIAGKANMTVSTMIGVAFGGWMYMRWGMFRSLLIFGIGQALTNLLYMWLALAGKKALAAGARHHPRHRHRRHGAGGVRGLPDVPVHREFQRHAVRAALGARDLAAESHRARLPGISCPVDRLGEFFRGHLPDGDARSDSAGDSAPALERTRRRATPRSEAAPKAQRWRFG